jgi:hypothetical protein
MSALLCAADSDEVIMLKVYQLVELCTRLITAVGRRHMTHDAMEHDT